MRYTFLLVSLITILSFSSCTDRHDEESEAMKNMVKEYPRPSIVHFQYGYESVLRAVLNALPEEAKPEVFEGVKKLTHFNDSEGSDLWFNDESGVKTSFFSDLVEEGFEELMSITRDGQAVTAYMKGQGIIHGAVVILETEGGVQIFDLAGNIDLKKLADLLQNGDLNTLDLINFDEIDF